MGPSPEPPPAQRVGQTQPGAAGAWQARGLRLQLPHAEQPGPFGISWSYIVASSLSPATTSGWDGTVPRAQDLSSHGYMLQDTLSARLSANRTWQLGEESPSSCRSSRLAGWARSTAGSRGRKGDSAPQMLDVRHPFRDPARAELGLRRRHRSGQGHLPSPRE